MNKAQWYQSIRLDDKRLLLKESNTFQKVQTQALRSKLPVTIAKYGEALRKMLFTTLSQSKGESYCLIIQEIHLNKQTAIRSHVLWLVLEIKFLGYDQNK